MTSITLKAPGKRQVIDEDRANEMIEGWKKQLAEAPEDTVVERVELSGESYHETAAAVLADYLVTVNSKVTEVDLSDIIASRPLEEGLAVLRSLCGAFADCDLVEVNLSENAMGTHGIGACEAVLNQQTKSMRRLYLENMGLAADSVQRVADILTTQEVGGCVCDNLTHLHLYNNMSDDEGALALLPVLAACKKLEDFRYSGCRAKREGSKALAEGLDAMGDNIARLKHLDLNGSIFGTGENAEEDGVILLSRALARATNLTRVNLRDGSLGPEGTELVTQALKESKAPLVELDLSENEATAEVSQSIADLLVDLVDNLEVFMCFENELTSTGVKRIVESLSSSASRLKELRLGLNECGHIGAVALCRAELPMLEALHLDGNMFPADDVEELETVFGEKLQDMEDNEPDEDVNHGLEADEGEVDELAEALAEKL